MCTSCKSTRFALFALAMVYGCTALRRCQSGCMEALCHGSVFMWRTAARLGFFRFSYRFLRCCVSGAGETLGSLMRLVLRVHHGFHTQMPQELC